MLSLTAHFVANASATHAAEKEFRELTRDEEALLRAAEATPGGAPVGDFSPALVQSLFRRHLIYLDVPVQPDQRFSTSSLEGFVSNRDLVAGDSDPMEALLYEVFVSNSERLRVAELADVLGKPLPQVQQAMSNAVRMGFAVLIEGVPALNLLRVVSMSCPRWDGSVPGMLRVESAMHAPLHVQHCVDVVFRLSGVKAQYLASATQARSKTCKRTLTPPALTTLASSRRRQLPSCWTQRQLPSS